MHRSITALIAAGLLLLAMAIPVSAAKPDAKGPACADIVFSANYVTDGGVPTVHFVIETTVPSCRNITYSGYVLSADGLTPLGSASTNGDGTAAFGDGSDEVGLSVALPGGPSAVCVYASSASSGGAVFDRAPDADCVQYTLDAGGGLSKYG